MKRICWSRAMQQGLLAIALVAVSGFATAQAQAVITGTVTSEQGQKLSNGNVYITELNVSVPTNPDGSYTITLSPARLRGATSITLRARAIGFTPTSRITTATSQKVDFRLRQDVNRLSEVVVSGVTAGTEQKKLAFNITHVDAVDLQRVSASDPLSALAGKVPGANITSASGRPGAPPAVILRSPTSISSSGRGVAPLYVVDGIILGDQMANTGGGGLTGINPQDIDNIEVIKGAAAASLYGTRAGNGVISITTKSAKGGSDGFRVRTRSEYGSSDIERKFAISDRTALRFDPTGSRFCITVAGYASNQCARTIDYNTEALRINNNNDVFALAPFTFPIDPGSTISATTAGNPLRNSFQIDKWPGTNYDAIQQFVQPKPYLQQNLEFSGKSGPNSVFASGSYLKQGGAIKYLNGFQRTTTRLNASRVTGNWNFDFTTSFAHDYKDGFQEEDGGSAFFRLTRVPPIVNLNALDNQGRLYIRPNLQGGGSQNYNPLYELQNYAQNTTTNRFIGGTTASWHPLTWASMDFNFSYDGAAANALFFQDKGYRTTTGPAGASNSGSLNKRTESQNQYNAGASLVLTHTFLSDFNTRTSFRYLFDRTDYNYMRESGNWLAVFGVPQGGNIGPTPSGSPSQAVTSTLQSTRGLGYFAAVDADWKDRYIIGGLIRRDASSLFGPGHRWATFGRGSLAWRVAQEPWWFVPQLDEFKIRASVGSAGNRPPFDAQYETYSLSNGSLSGSATQIGNKQLRPETVVETEFGVDAEAFHRVGLNVTWAKSEARDQILLVPLATYFGAPNQYQNAGTLSGKSFEASVNIPWIQGKDFTYSTRLSYDRARSVITKLSVPPYTFGSSAQATDKLFFARQGEVYGTFYGRQFMTSCGQLPTAAAASCGAGLDFQKNNEGYIVYVGAGNTVNDGVTKNLWQSQAPMSSSFYAPTTAAAGGQIARNVPIFWGMPIVNRDSTGTAKVVALGQALPKYRYSVGQTANYKRLNAYALVDAAVGRSVYNQGRGWSYLDFLSGDETSTTDPSTAKPLGYFYRAGLPDNSAGTGGFYDVLGPNSRFVENASYAKLREVTVGYHIGALGSVGGDWTLSGTGRNLHTWTKYKGFDPEVGFGAVSGTGGSTGNAAGSAAINAVDAFQFPNLRTYTVSLSTSF